MTTPSERAPRLGFTLTELLAALCVIALLLGLAFPAGQALLRSASSRAATARVMDVLENARAEAVGSGREVWVVLRHDGRKGKDSSGDALRVVVREGRGASPLGPWSKLPSGAAFRTGSGAIPDEPAPSDILAAACGSPSATAGVTTGALMFRRSGDIGRPGRGGNSLVVPIDTATGASTVTLTRGTGRPSCSGRSS